MTFIKPKLYLDPSVFSHYFDEDEPDKKTITRRFFDVELASGRYEVVSSEITLQVLKKYRVPIPGDELVKFAESLPVTYLPVTDAVNGLAQKLVAEGLIAVSNQKERLHLAFGLVHHVKYIVSWDHKQMVNPKTQKAVKIMSLKEGLIEIKIITPEAVALSGDEV